MTPNIHTLSDFTVQFLTHLPAQAHIRYSPNLKPISDRINPVFINVCEVQETASILKIGWALSKSPYLHRAYLVS